MAWLSGSEVVAEYLIKEKTPYIAGLPGHGALAFVDAFRKRRNKIDVIMVKHEQSAVHIADAYCRVTGKPMACFTSIGPGAINTLVGVGTAFMDSIPVVVFTANCPTYMNERGAMQEIERNHWADFPAMIRPIVKRTWNITNATQLIDVLPRAFRVATSGRPGPVHIDLPMDVQAQMVKAEVPDPSKYKVLPEGVGYSGDVSKAVELLLKAKRPLILIGGGIISAEATEELRKVAEMRCIPVVAAFNGKGAMSEDHPLWSYYVGFMGSTCGNALAQKCDVLLAVGTRFSEWTCSSYKPGVTWNIPPTKVIHIDIDPREIAKNYPVEVGILGDAKVALRSMLEGLEEESRVDWKRSTYFKEIQQLKDKWHKIVLKWQTAATKSLTTVAFLKEMRGFLDRDAIVTGDAGHSQAQLWQTFPMYYPRTHISSGGFSTMGFAVAGAIGAQLAAPNKQVVAFVGDGGFLMTCQELSAAVQYNLPIVFCISNNNAWCSIRDMQRAWYGKKGMFGTEFYVKGTEKFSNPDFVKLGEAFGLPSQRITKKGQVKGALKKAFASDGPALLEVMTDRTYPNAELPPTGWADYPTPEYLRKKGPGK